MKDSFKTFPKLVADPTTNEKNIIAWKNRIEKELREKKEFLIKHIKEHLGKGESTIVLEAYLGVTREILGETEATG